MIRVVVVDDHPHVAIALDTLLDRVPDIQLVGETNRGSKLISFVRKTRPDVLLLDLFIEPGFDAI
jgi:DNA-binding NarL/FixJ family response regulator